MAEASDSQQRLLQIIRRQLVPWVHAAGGHTFVLAQAPLFVPPNIRISAQPAPILRNSAERSYFSLSHWRDAGLEASRFPYFGCVLEGEADLLIGSPAKQSRRAGEKGRKPALNEEESALSVVSALPGTFLLYPPGIPHEDGSGPHWSRAYPECASAKIFWMSILPAGVLCHTCTTVKGSHCFQPGLFIRDPHLLTISQLLMEELEGRDSNFEAIAQSFMLTLLLRIERGLGSGIVLPANEIPRADLPEDNIWSSDAASNLVLQRASQYIRSHLNEALTPQLVARHAYISTPHLSRLFRLRQGTTIMKFVLHCRIEQARSLLQDTDLPIREVGRLVGYRRPAHFSTLFTKVEGQSPVEFRKSKRVT